MAEDAIKIHFLP